MALNFPTSPALNEIYDRWQWNGDRWIAAPPPPATAYLPLHGGTMSGPILQPVPPATAAAVPNRAYVDEAIATQALYQGVWTAQTNDPDLSASATHRDGFMWLVTTPNPDLPFTVTATGIAGLTGNEVHNGDRVIWSTVAAEFQVVPGGGLTQTQGDLRYLMLSGGTMTGDIVLDGDAAANLNPVPLQQVHEILADYPLKTEAVIKGVPGTYTQVTGTPANDFEFNDFQTLLDEKINNHWFDATLTVNLTIDNAAGTSIVRIGDVQFSRHVNFIINTSARIANTFNVCNVNGVAALNIISTSADTWNFATLTGIYAGMGGTGGAHFGDTHINSGTNLFLGRSTADDFSVRHLTVNMGCAAQISGTNNPVLTIQSINLIGTLVIPSGITKTIFPANLDSHVGQIIDTRPSNTPRRDTFIRNARANIVLTVDPDDLQAAINSLPKYLTGNCTINVNPGTTTQNIDVQRFIGSGTLVINGAGGNPEVFTHNVGSMTVQYCNVARLGVYGITCNVTGGNGFFLQNCIGNFLYIWCCNVVGTPNIGFNSNESTYGYFSNCWVNNANQAFRGRSGHVRLSGPRGLANNGIVFRSEICLLQITDRGSVDGTTMFSCSEAGVIFDWDGNIHTVKGQVA